MAEVKQVSPLYFFCTLFVDFYVTKLVSMSCFYPAKQPVTGRSGRRVSKVKPRNKHSSCVVQGKQFNSRHPSQATSKNMDSHLNSSTNSVLVRQKSLVTSYKPPRKGRRSESRIHVK